MGQATKTNALGSMRLAEPDAQGLYGPHMLAFQLSMPCGKNRRAKPEEGIREWFCKIKRVKYPILYFRG
jgi:hypothetical protein